MRWACCTSSSANTHKHNWCQGLPLTNALSSVAYNISVYFQISHCSITLTLLSETADTAPDSYNPNMVDLSEYLAVANTWTQQGFFHFDSFLAHTYTCTCIKVSVCSPSKWLALSNFCSQEYLPVYSFYRLVPILQHAVLPHTTCTVP